MSLPKRIPVIIDTDPGVDDVLALLLALASPELEILAITITFGNTGVEECYANVLKVFDIIARHVEEHPDDGKRFPNFDSNAPIILAKGSSLPSGGSLHTAKYFHGRDGLADISKRHPELAIRKVPLEGTRQFHNLILSEESACSVTVKLIRDRAEREITYIALGPLSNFASAFRAEQELVSGRLGRVVCMGGTFEAPGNTTPVAEFNFYADPYAVRDILGLDGRAEIAHFPLNRFVLIPLDITTKHGLELTTYVEKVDSKFGDSGRPSEEGSKPIIQHFTSSILERTWEVMKSFGIEELHLHDPSAVWCAIRNPAVVDEGDLLPLMGEGWACQLRNFDIERTGELTRGMLVVDRRRSAGGRPGENRATGASAGAGAGERARVAVLTATPGQSELVKLLLLRVWGVHF